MIKVSRSSTGGIPQFDQLKFEVSQRYTRAVFNMTLEQYLEKGGQPLEFKPLSEDQVARFLDEPDFVIEPATIPLMPAGVLGGK